MPRRKKVTETETETETIPNLSIHEDLSDNEPLNRAESEQKSGSQVLLAIWINIEIRNRIASHKIWIDVDVMPTLRALFWPAVCLSN